MDNKVFAKVSSRIESLKAESDAERDMRAEKIKQAEASLAVSREIAENALKNGDEETFTEHRRKMHDAEDRLDLHSSRLHKLDHELIVSEKEYQQTRDAIISVLDSANVTARDEIVKRLEEINQIADDLGDLIKQGNGILREWESCTNHIKTIPGGVMNDALYKGWSVVFFVGQVRERPEYLYFVSDKWLPSGYEKRAD
ncbi:MAG: hypothetical protein IKF39_02555 [Oscillospiraceae bacterium]|nr:hypothetical protein [Oscillospiraceae bacterium]